MPTPAVIFLALGVAAVLAGIWLASRDGRLDAADTRPDVGMSIMDTRRSDRQDATEADLINGITAIRTAPPAEDPHAWAESCGHIAELVTAALCRIEARRGPGRHRHYYTGEWPLLAELATAGERSAA